MAQDDSSEWEQSVTEDGKKYYYNRITRQSLWTLPTSSVDVGKGAVSDDSNDDDVSSLPTDWIEHIDPSTGKRYYYNKETNQTTWERPSSSSREDIDDTNTNNKDKDKDKDTEDTRWMDDPKIKFKTMLKELNVTKEMTFEMLQPFIIKDIRYQVLPTLEERRMVFQEYVDELQSLADGQRSAVDKAIRMRFMDMLDECHESINRDMPWERVQLYFGGDDVWESIEEESERQRLFQLHFRRHDQAARDRAEQTKNQRLDKILCMFQADPSIDASSQWRQVKDHYEHDPIIQQADMFDVLDLFGRHITSLQLREEANVRRRRDEQKQRERADRDAFRAFLNECGQGGQLNAGTKWRHFSKQYASHPALAALKSEIAEEIFEDYREELEERYSKDFKLLKSIVKQVNFNLQQPIDGQHTTTTTTLDNMIQIISKHDDFNKVLSSNIPPFFRYVSLSII
ncbi:hypothetical protein SAMD00019534_087540, partial [Acytostelium subglobosum LB1]|uniref:hypothetical protein n=1 Tax=Acytostelium subglobosum LB1 TaxID=1410327 RepID=UPI000644A49F